jgi:hypothetical protein
MAFICAATDIKRRKVAYTLQFLVAGNSSPQTSFDIATARLSLHHPAYVTMTMQWLRR